MNLKKKKKEKKNDFIYQRAGAVLNMDLNACLQFQCYVKRNKGPMVDLSGHSIISINSKIQKWCEKVQFVRTAGEFNFELEDIGCNVICVWDRMS